MGFTYSFVDNKSYGVDDINGIVSSLVGAGVAPFTSKSSYTPSEINSLTSAVVTKGVQLDGCKCIKLGTTSVKISQGIVFFENGVTLTVDSSGYTISISSNATGYIIAEYDVSLQTAKIGFKSTLPASGIFVKLARLASGELIDERKFCRAKFGSIGKNACLFTYPKTCHPQLHTPNIFDSSYETYITAKLVGVDLSVFNYLVSGYRYKSNTGNLVLFDLKANKFIEYNPNIPEFRQSGQIYGSGRGVGVNNGIIEFYSRGNNMETSGDKDWLGEDNTNLPIILV